MAATGGIPKNRELPSKEAALFKQILKFYEHKQYKKGLKMAEQILKKFPNHGETLAMKGLFLSNLDRKEEGYEMVKLGVRNDLTSHISWHVFGLMHRADKNYEEALKCYSHALKYDKENLQIMRDFSLLQIQMRNYEAFNESRHALLNLKPGLKPHWIGLAISYHLLKNYEMAIKILTSYLDSMQETPEGVYEMSELLMYKNWIIEESGDLEAALKDLEDIKSRVVDRVSWREAKGRMLLETGKNEEAIPVFESLMRTNADQVLYIESLAKARSITLSRPFSSDESMNKALKFLQELSAKYPRSHVLKRMILDVAQGERFQQLADDYLKTALRKGVPSLFVSLKPIYTPTKMPVFESLILSYIENLRTSSSFSENGEKESPTALSWALFYAASHYDHKRDTKKALEFVDELLEQTPTLVEAHMLKGRILKHAGDLQSAMESMDTARQLDLQDRFVNNKCTKYMLRNNNIEQAEKTISLFTKAESIDPVGDLADMQCMWFALESANALLRTNQIGPALKRLHQIEKHFYDIYDDQFDFHTYCLRKMTLKSYVQFLRMEDRLHDQIFYETAAVNAAKVYLDLHLNPPPENKDNVNTEGLSASERKKLARKARKAELKAAETNVAQNAPTNTTANATVAKDGKPVKKDEDPLGEQYLKVEDKLKAGLKILTPLLNLKPKSITAWTLGCELYARRGLFAPSARCLINARQLDSTTSSPELIRALLVFWSLYQEAVKDGKVKDVIMELVNELVGDVFWKEGKELDGWVDNCLSTNSKDVQKMMAVIAFIETTDETRARSLYESLVKDITTGAASLSSIEEAKSLHKLLKAKQHHSLTSELVKFVSSKFPYAKLQS